MTLYISELCKFCTGKIFSFLTYQEDGLVFCCKECADDYKEGKTLNESDL